LSLTPQQFNRKFKESPVQRARRRGYLRNVLVAAGNSGEAAVIPALERLADGEDSLLAEHARWALERLKAD
jgi:epoxyqueuosine reductase